MCQFVAVVFSALVPIAVGWRKEGRKEAAVCFVLTPCSEEGIRCCRDRVRDIPLELMNGRAGTVVDIRNSVIQVQAKLFIYTVYAINCD